MDFNNRLEQGTGRLIDAYDGVFAKAREAGSGSFAVAVQRAGWLQKARYDGPHRTWQRVWCFLVADRFCWAGLKLDAASYAGATYQEAGDKLASSVSMASLAVSGAWHGSGRDAGHPPRVRYVPLDRVPVRSIPRRYVPSVGVTLVDDR